MANREHHYWVETGHSEYWEQIGDSEWYLVDKSFGEEWLIDSYDYKSWNENSGAVAKKGLPPRVWW